MPNKPNYASPTEFSEGGGSLYDECWIKITGAKTELTSKFNKPTPVINLDLIEHESQESHNELFLIGSSDNWDVDGAWMISKGGFKLSKNNTAGVLLADIHEAGFQWNTNDLNVSQLVGHYFWIHRYELKDRDGNPIPVKNAEGQDRGFNKTAITFVKWGGNGTEPQEQGAAQPIQQPATKAAPANEEAIAASISTLLTGGPKPHQDILNALATTPPAGTTLETMMPLVAPGAAWMLDAARPWTVANGVVTAK